jgi:CubicO group peptidase (beta-lactamase class C family)
MEVIKVKRLLNGKRAAWSIAALLGIVALATMAIFSRWFMVAGPQGGFDAVLRFVQHGSTTIEDFKHYPARRLTPSASPFRFTERADGRLVPEAVEIAAAGQRRLDEVLSTSETIAFLIVRDDTILFERYYGGHAAESLSQYFSVSKSVTAALVGAAIDDGIIRATEQKVVDFVPEFVGRGFDRLTIRHLLTMTSGIDYQEDDNPFGLHVPFNYTSDTERMMLAFQMKTEPGIQFRYKSGDVGLLSLVLSRALAPKTITAYAQERLWTPLGMENEGVWSLDRDNGLEKAWCCLAGTARDLAKIGRLYLAQGEWNGARILSPSWIERSVHDGGVDEILWPADFAAAGFWNYGYLWWLLARDERDYLAQGKDGQFLYVNPMRRTIIVRLGRDMGELRTSQWVSLFRFLARETR